LFNSKNKRGDGKLNFYETRSLLQEIHALVENEDTVTDKPMQITDLQYE